MKFTDAVSRWGVNIALLIYAQFVISHGELLTTGFTVIEKLFAHVSGCPAKVFIDEYSRRF